MAIARYNSRAATTKPIETTMSASTIDTSQAARHIVIEGPIGVGKTALAKRLAASLKAQLILEKSDDNPFLARFYKHPQAYALPTQLAFLLARSSKLQPLAQADMFAPRTVCNFLLERDLIFAAHNLGADELKLYRALYQQLATPMVTPDLVIYLQAPPDILRERILKRGISYERRIDFAYLEHLAAAYMRFFHQYQASALLIVNAAELNFADNDADYQQLLAQICAPVRGRQYFNPSHL